MRRTDGRMSLKRHFIIRFDDMLGARKRRGRVTLNLGFGGRAWRGATDVVEEFRGGWKRCSRRPLPVHFQLSGCANGLLFTLAYHCDVVAATDHANKSRH